MKKDITVINLITTLKDRIDFSLLEIIDYWEADLCAIGIRKNNKIVYISTFNYINDSAIRYDFDLELIDGEQINIIKQGRNVSQSLLVTEMELFFDL